ARQGFARSYDGGLRWRSDIGPSARIRHSRCPAWVEECSAVYPPAVGAYCTDGVNLRHYRVVSALTTDPRVQEHVHARLVREVGGPVRPPLAAAHQTRLDQFEPAEQRADLLVRAQGHLVRAPAAVDHVRGLVDAGVDLVLG